MPESNFWDKLRLQHFEAIILERNITSCLWYSYLKRLWWIHLDSIGINKSWSKWKCILVFIIKTKGMDQNTSSLNLNIFFCDGFFRHSFQKWCHKLCIFFIIFNWMIESDSDWMTILSPSAHGSVCMVNL